MEHWSQSLGAPRDADDYPKLPCESCRRRHLKCDWSDPEQCDRCRNGGRICSGPASSGASRKKPCDSCARSKIRCVWLDNDLRCQHCIDRGSDVCPMPARKKLVPRESRSSSSSRSSTLQQSDLDLADDFLSSTMTRALVISGRERLVAVESPLAAWVDQVPFTSPYVALAKQILAIAGLRLTAFPGSHRGGRSATATIPIEKLCTNSWRVKRRTLLGKAEAIDKLMAQTSRALCTESESGTVPSSALSPANASPFIAGGLFLCAYAMNTFGTDPKNLSTVRETARQLALMCHAEAEARSTMVTDVQRQVLLSLMVLEARLSLQLSRPSAIDHETFSLCLLPLSPLVVIPLVSTFTPYLLQGMTTDEAVSHLVMAIVRPATNLAHRILHLAASLETPDLASWLDDIKVQAEYLGNAMESVRKARDECNAIAVTEEAIIFTNGRCRKIMGELIIGALEVLDVATIILVSAKNQSSPSSQLDVTFGHVGMAQAAEIQLMLANTAEHLFSTTMKMALAYNVLNKFLGIMAIHAEHFPEAIVLVPHDRRKWLIWSIDLCDLWDESAVSINTKFSEKAGVLKETPGDRERSLGAFVLGELHRESYDL